MTQMPPSLTDKLDSLAHRVRSRRLLRGISLTLFTLALAVGAALAVDARFAPTGPARAALLGACGAAGLVAAWFTLVRPLRRPIAPADLAAAIEREHPALAERLSSTVELSSDGAHGSPKLIALLARETEARARRVDFAAPGVTRRATPVALLAGVTLSGLVVAAVLVPEVRQSARRILLPFRDPAKDIAYRWVVTSGDPAVERGSHVNLSGYLEPMRDGALLPEAAELLVRATGDVATDPEVVPMRSDQPNVFHHRVGSVTEGFEYALRAGEAVSGWHAVRAVDPVTLTGDTEVSVTPPEYARAVLGEIDTMPGLPNVSALQYGQVRFDLHFDAPPQRAYFEVRTPKNGSELVVPLALEGSMGRCDRVTLEDAAYRLVLVSRDGVRTELPPLEVRVRIDQPPRFAEVTGVTAEPRAVPPGESVPVRFTVTDDVAVAGAAIEYRVDGGDVLSEVVELPGAGTGEATGSHLLSLSEKVREGQRFEYRIRATDNRDVPEAELGPQSTYYPAGDRWAELRIESDAAPMKEQEILARKKEIDEKLDELIRDLKADARAIDAIRSDTQGKDELGLQDSLRIQEQWQRARESAEALERLADEAAVAPAFQPLADQFRDVAERQLRDAEEAMRQADRAGNDAERKPALDRGQKGTDEAGRRLEQLRERADQLARDEIDRERLDRLAKREQDLADQAGEADPDELKRKQDELRRELEELARENPELAEAMRADRGEQAQRLAGEARDLAEQQRELREAMRETDARTRGQKFGELMARQQDLTDRLEKFARQNEPAARAAQTGELDTKPARDALKSMEQGELAPALKEMERAAMNLDRMAADFNRATAKATEPREAARQLARLQDDLRQRLAKAPEADEAIEELKQEQRAIEREIDRLSVPPNERAANSERQNARSKSAQASEALEAEDADTAGRRMAETRDALEQLAQKLERSVDERRRDAARELERLRRDQEALAREESEGAAGRQAELADRLERTDTPNAERRRERAAEAMRRAAADLERERPGDAAASQEDALQQLRRLEEALAGKEPADERADRLAREQREIAEEADRLAKKPSSPEGDPQVEQLRKRQEELGRQMRDIEAPEAPLQREDAAEALRRAADAAAGDDPERLARESGEAADAMQRLAARMNGRGDDAERAERLARRQAEAAEQAGENSNDPGAAADAERLARRMEEEARRLRAGEAQQEKQEAIERLQRLQQEGRAADPEAQGQAAEALRDLADRMAGSAPEEGEQGPAGEREERRANLPNRDTAERAREMAREMRELREELYRSASELKREAAQPTPPEGNPVGELARRQEELAQRAGELAEEMGRRPDGSDPAGQAAEAAERAAERMRSGSMEAAREAGRQAAERMEQLARSADGETGERARELSREQSDINGQMDPLAENPGAARAQQQARQQELTDEARRLAERLREAAEAMSGDREGDPARAREAASNAEQARDRMRDAQARQREGRNQAASDAQQQAAEQLERAAQQAMRSAGRQPGDQPQTPEQRQLAEALREAMEQAGQAGEQLGRRQEQGARRSMEQAARQLEEAARQFGQMRPGGEPPQMADRAPMPGPEGGPADGGPLGDEARQYAGKAWGELPGDVRSRILDDFRERYGIDDARVIKYYFEQLAATK